MSDEKFTVERNHCQCHPETCCCSRWNVADQTGEVWASFHSRQRADRIADALNTRAQLSAQSVSAVQPVANISDYEEVLADHRRLVRELDVALNGEEGAVKQASLCDIVGQVKHHGWKLVRATNPADADAVDAKRLQLIIDNAAMWLSENALAHIMHKGITVRELIDAAIAVQSTEGAKG